MHFMNCSAAVIGHFEDVELSPVLLRIAALLISIQILH